ncbi:hypothetical protein [uncultured Ruminococcus sp.]|uniref:hypothetical protein n=1 Tax=uncultured Ruminococcus sp. TaxID=165186 RepID=UPI00266C57C1|nr:hypothetical protein [uncultured Ruminococcus sp.]
MDKNRVFSTGGAAWKVARRSLCGIAFRQQRQNAGTGAGCRVAGMPSCSGTLGQPAELSL